MKLGLLRGKSATINVLFATIVFMAGGVLGTFHHLYFSGTTTAVVALGASFSALEVVPLALIGLEAYETWSHSRATPWMERYRWPIMFFLAVSFWNLVGAGLFGFLINTADRAVLHAGPEPHAAAWPHRAVRRVRHARHRPDAVLPARPARRRWNGRPACCAARSGASTSAWR